MGQDRPVPSRVGILADSGFPTHIMPTSDVTTLPRDSGPVSRVKRTRVVWCNESPEVVHTGRVKLETEKLNTYSAFVSCLGRVVRLQECLASLLRTVVYVVLYIDAI